MSDNKKSEKNERQPLTFEQAADMLPDGDHIHTFTNPGGLLLGADWPREKLLALFREKGAELAGEMATRMDHGIWVNTEHARGLFVQTKKGAMP